MTNQIDERVSIDEIPLVIAVDYIDEPQKHTDIRLLPGRDPFILFQMKQEGGVVVLDVTASMIPGEDDLIETLEAFFETMLAERERRRLGSLGVVEGEVVELEQWNNEEAPRG